MTFSVCLAFPLNCEDLGCRRVQSHQLFLPRGAFRASVQDRAAFPPSWLSCQAPECVSAPLPSTTAWPRRRGGRQDPAGPAQAFVAQVGERECGRYLSTSSNPVCPHVSPHSYDFPQPSITCPSHLGLVAHKEQIDLGTQCNLLIPSRVSPPPIVIITHTHWKGMPGSGQEQNPDLGENIYIYIIIYTYMYL